MLQFVVDSGSERFRVGQGEWEAVTLTIGIAEYFLLFQTRVRTQIGWLFFRKYKINKLMPCKRR